MAHGKHHEWRIIHKAGERDQPACGAVLNTAHNKRQTTNDAEVTCRRCLALNHTRKDQS